MNETPKQEIAEKESFEPVSIVDKDGNVICIENGLERSICEGDNNMLNKILYMGN